MPIVLKSYKIFDVAEAPLHRGETPPCVSRSLSELGENEGLAKVNAIAAIVISRCHKTDLVTWRMAA
jgi:hypothetical protein